MHEFILYFNITLVRFNIYINEFVNYVLKTLSFYMFLICFLTLLVNFLTSNWIKNKLFIFNILLVHLVLNCLKLRIRFISSPIIENYFLWLEIFGSGSPNFFCFLSEFFKVKVTLIHCLMILYTVTIFVNPGLKVLSILFDFNNMTLFFWDFLPSELYLIL